MGGFLALCAAMTFAFNNTLARRGVLTGSVMQAMAISVPLGVPLFLIAAFVTDALPMLADASVTSLFFMAAAGVVHFVCGRYCNYRAVKAIGANLAGPLTEASVLVALGLAVALLGEKLTPMKLLGIFLILSGPALTVGARRKPPVLAPLDGEDGAGVEIVFTPHYVEGYFFSILAAIAYGISPILVRFALERTGWQASIAAGLVSYIAATLVTFIVIVASGQLRHTCSISRTTLKWFCGAGFFVGLSQMLRYMALSLAPVSVVSPIQRLSLIFRLVFSLLMNRKYEIFNSRMVLGTIVSLLGAILLSISIEAVHEVLPIPAALVPAFTWQWP